MKTKLLLLFVMVLTCTHIILATEKVDYKKSYNYQRGEDLLFNDNNESEALKFFNKEIDEHKENGYAYYWIGLIHEKNDRIGKAIDAANKAIKYLKNDKHWQSYAYRLHARVSSALGDEATAVADYGKAIKLTPDEPEPYQARGDYYYDKNQYELADADYLAMTKVAPGDTYGYMALGRNAIATSRFDSAIEHFNYAMKLDPEYSSAYAFRSEAQLKLKKYAEASDDVIKALNIDNRDPKAYHMIQEIADSAYEILDLKMQTQLKRKPNDSFWIYVMGNVQEQTKRYKKAISFYESAFEKDANDVVAARIASCYEDLNDYPMALEYINRAIDLDSTYSNYQIERVQIEEFAGMTYEALHDVNIYISNFPDDYFGYYKRGWLLDKYKDDLEKAIEDYTTSAALQPSYDYNYLCRGQLYRRLGKDDLAIKDFNEVLKLDTVPSERGNARQYALFYLGDTIKSIEWMNRILTCDSLDDKSGNLYDAACLYSLMGNTKQSLEYMRQCLDLGWSRFTHARKDDDLKNLRELPEFEEMLQQYENERLTKKETESVSQDTLVEKEAEIPFAKEGGICKVRCTINDLPLYFVFDTGASDVSISSVEAIFMLKNNYLSKSDMTGKGYYINANGDISEGTLITLKEVNFGGLTLKNIKASVVKNQKAPLLLGQSVLSRLGRIEIDNNQKVIRVKYKENH